MVFFNVLDWPSHVLNLTEHVFNLLKKAKSPDTDLAEHLQGRYLMSGDVCGSVIN